jgi:hypothetical protein
MVVERTENPVTTTTTSGGGRKDDWSKEKESESMETDDCDSLSKGSKRKQFDDSQSKTFIGSIGLSGIKIRDIKFYIRKLFF